MLAEGDSRALLRVPKQAQGAACEKHNGASRSPHVRAGGTHAALRFINKYCYYKIGQTQYQQLKRESALTQSSLLIPDFTVPAKAQLIYAKALIWQTPKAVVIVRVHENFIFLKPKLYLKTFCSTLGAQIVFSNTRGQIFQEHVQTSFLGSFNNTKKSF